MLSGKYRQILVELWSFQKRSFNNKDELNAGIQKLRNRIGKWYNSNLHQPICSGSIKVLSTYNQCLRERGYDSEFELNDDGVTYSDLISAESNASDLRELKEVNEDLNPLNDIVVNANVSKDNSMEMELSASNSEDNSMEMEHSANNVNLSGTTTNVKSDNIEIDSIG
ncbi:hypothetical protein AVEN_182512-1 [Araneus ventricosus]|uniref:Uncharacterized protein n=1 Tax=Araneus ventricosus TaxID=182803 RepID=A0A4Y2BYQ8_ARAVE|nr:hypothetical protein AVEN_182512-1 [Araneus ventricosus]